MIRVATRADLERIGEIRMAVRENRLTQPAKIVDQVEWLIDRDGFWVWDQDGTIQGFSSADPRDGSIFALFIDPDFEGRGAGQALLAAACAALKGAGHCKAWLTTGHGTRAERFYRLNGWAATGLADNGQIVFEKGFAG
ncbi:GNAT family N-acetyltransferase [Phreatobacter stygius]|uniref:GNAT family N-acetyltransferase n=1 Tax=Phreatobacter stygius TaxID=1940610 RepID=A0A4D7B318_9HYPH|nr:GNAT family N-acetyltransferase [Phreatobacter stygius]QCI65695.1 GNAT family N-acetyltransferase [Phreatobacter stygius]